MRYFFEISALFNQVEKCANFLITSSECIKSGTEVGITSSECIKSGTEVDITSSECIESGTEVDITSYIQGAPNPEGFADFRGRVLT